MSTYIDAIVIPVPRANLDTYKRMSTEWGNAHVRHGARLAGTIDAPRGARPGACANAWPPVAS